MPTSRDEGQERGREMNRWQRPRFKVGSYFEPMTRSRMDCRMAQLKEPPGACSAWSRNMYSPVSSRAQAKG